MEVIAKSRQVKVSPSKVRPVLDLVRGKKVEEALAILKFMPMPSAQLVAKTIKSASANAENNYQVALDSLRITKIFADKGQTLKRFRPRARGRASPILKRRAHITVVVEEEL